MDFSETTAIYVVKVGMFCKLNELMKIHMCLNSRSFFDLGPRLLRCSPHQHFQTSSPQKPIGPVKVNLHLDPWDGGMKVC